MFVFCGAGKDMVYTWWLREITRHEELHLIPLRKSPENPNVETLANTAWDQCLKAVAVTILLEPELDTFAFRGIA